MHDNMHESGKPDAKISQTQKDKSDPGYMQYLK